MSTQSSYFQTVLLIGILASAGAAVYAPPPLSTHSESPAPREPAAKETVQAPAPTMYPAGPPAGEPTGQGQPLAVPGPVLYSQDESNPESDSARAEPQPSPLQKAALPPVPQQKPAAPRETVIQVQDGDTLSGILTEAGVTLEEKTAIASALAESFDLRFLNPGQTVRLTFTDSGPSKTDAGHEVHLDRLHVQGGTPSSIEVARTGPEIFAVKMSGNDEKNSEQYLSGTIINTLSQAAHKANLPNRILQEMVNAYSYDVDFQRDIRRGDRFTVLYENAGSEGKPTSRGVHLVHAILNLSGEKKHIYRFRNAEGEWGFYDQDGQNVRKGLLRTPINSARLSSPYGMRKHPILGYNRMHRGVDFAAPTGTPIYAAGSGRIVRIGRNGDYGHYIKIDHNGQFSTAYAHLSRYAKGMKVGTNVHQGQIIGYVGSTGLSSGPHLHFEVWRKGKSINPLDVKLPSIRKLTGNDLERFEQIKSDIQRRYAGPPSKTALVRK